MVAIPVVDRRPHHRSDQRQRLGGQCLNIIPQLALVVVVTAGVYDFDGKGYQNLACDTVMEEVLRAELAR